MRRYFGGGRHLHRPAGSCGWRVRARALLDDYRPWRPAPGRANGGWRGSAERLNRHRYHGGWSQSLLASASLGGYRRRNDLPHNP